MSDALTSWRERGQTLRFGAHAIFYRTGGHGGAGPNLLCIHGLPTASWDWHLLWPTLTEHCARVLAPDMLGFGFSDKPPEHRYSIAEQADLHEQLLRAQGITHTHVLAHDYGVTVAQELLARDQERRARGDDSLRLESVTFLNGGLFPESHRPMLIQRLMLTPLGPLLSRFSSFGTFKRSFSRVFGPRTKPSERALRQFWSLVEYNDGKPQFYRLFHYIPERKRSRARWVGALQDSVVPLRLINGPTDPVSGAHLVTRYRELVAKPDVVVLDGIGHYPQIEAPEKVLMALLPMLR